MNFKVFAVLIAFVLAMCAASPVAEPEQAEIDPQVEQFVTCDIIGSDALCAVRCIGMGFRGGFCNGQKVCQCRN